MLCLLRASWVLVTQVCECVIRRYRSSVRVCVCVCEREEQLALCWAERAAAVMLNTSAGYQQSHFAISSLYPHKCHAYAFHLVVFIAMYTVCREKLCVFFHCHILIVKYKVYTASFPHFLTNEFLCFSKHSWLLEDIWGANFHLCQASIFWINRFEYQREDYTVLTVLFPSEDQ